MFFTASTEIAKQKQTDFVAIDPVVLCEVVEACSAGVLSGEAVKAGSELMIGSWLHCKPTITTLWEG